MRVNGSVAAIQLYRFLAAGNYAAQDIVLAVVIHNALALLHLDELWLALEIIKQKHSSEFGKAQARSDLWEPRLFGLTVSAAFFIDESGFALHINDRARRLLGPQLWVDDGRLRAADFDLDEALAAAIESALAVGAQANAATDLSFASESRGALAVKIMPVVVGADDPFQLLRAIVIIEERDASARRPHMARRDGLN